MTEFYKKVKKTTMLLFVVGVLLSGCRQWNHLPVNISVTPTLQFTVTPTPAPTPMPTPVPTMTPTPTQIPASTTVAPTATPIPGNTPSEMLHERLSDVTNYAKGYYKHWGGEFDYSETGVCALEFFKTSSDIYYFYSNDSRITVTIQQYDKDFKWINPPKEYRKLSSGGEFILEKETAYISLTLWSTEWGLDILSLFDHGLVIDILEEKPTFEEPIIAFEEIDWNNEKTWIHAKYSDIDATIKITDNALSISGYCRVDSTKKYMVSLPHNTFRVQIVELSAKKEVLRSQKMYDSAIWVPSVDTSYAAISVYSTDKSITVSELETIFDFQKNVINLYDSENYNKVMRDVSATEFVKYMNVGWNLGNSFDSKEAKRGLDANLSQETRWFNPVVTEELIDYVAACGFTTIRIPVTWYYNTEVDADGNLVIGKGFLERVKQVVNYAIQNDLYVILNSHHDDEMIYTGVSDTEIGQVYKDAEALWTQIAEYFKNYDEHLIFEAFNEVDNRERSWTYGDRAAAQLNRLNQIFVDTVRKTGGNNKKRIVMVSTLMDKYNERMLSGFVLPKDSVDDRLIVQLHCYAKSFSQAIDSDFALMEEYGKIWGVPIVIGEFGTTKQYFEPALRTVHAANFVARAAEHGIKCIWWDNGGDYAIINRKNPIFTDKSMVDALFQGVAGAKCEMPQEIKLSLPNQFTDGALDDSAAIKVNPYWGALTTDINGNAVEIKEGSHCILTLKAQGGASDVFLGQVSFYDKNGQVVNIIKNDVSRSTTVIKGIFWECNLTKEIRMIRVAMYDPFINIKRNQYDESLNTGDLELNILIFNLDEVMLQ